MRFVPFTIVCVRTFAHNCPWRATAVFMGLVSVLIKGSNLAQFYAYGVYGLTNPRIRRDRPYQDASGRVVIATSTRK